MLVIIILSLLSTLLLIFLIIELSKKNCPECPDNCPECPSCEDNNARIKNNMCSTDDLSDPGCCTKPVTKSLPSLCNSIVSGDTCTGSNTCALELILGGSTHMTVSYICNCDDKDSIISDVIEHIENNWKDEIILNIELGKMMDGFFEKNSRCIVGKLAKLKSFVTDFLIDKGYCVETGVWGGTPHTEVLWKTDPTCRTPNLNVNITEKTNWKLD